MVAVTASTPVWRFSLLQWLAIAVAVAVSLLLFFTGLSYMVESWGQREEYSYGYIIPFLTLFLIWQKKDQLEQVPFKGSWAGTAVVAVGLALFFVGELSTLYIIVQYAFLTVVAGLVLAYVGWRGFRLVWVPLLLLVFMVPLPNFLYQGLSSHLQLLSSEIGVAVIRLFGISVFLEGNVIDLGTYKLQVVEACNGLRYLFPLMTLGFIAAYFFKAPLWKRAVVFLSTIPITVLMNSFRIGVIGVMVEYWGEGMAEGFLHDFEGWVVFMACTALLVLEIWLLAKIGKDPRPMREVFGMEFPEPTPRGARVQVRAMPKPFLVAFGLLAAMAVANAALPERTEIVPARKEFSDFPFSVGAWQGKEDRLEQIYLDALKLDDYVIADFVSPEGKSVNFYVAYYASQRKGESAHSPRSCLPGGGWEISDLTQRTLPGAEVAGRPLTVNRTVIRHGDNRQLVYYWFQQRGRVITNEYLVKWYLMWDAITRQRTDGALVRLITPLTVDEAEGAADRRLTAFAVEMSRILPQYVPN